MAGREGFEPPEALTSTVFKTAAFNRSAISRKLNYIKDRTYSVFSFTQVAPSLTFSLVHSPASLVSCLTPDHVFEHPEKTKIKAKMTNTCLILNSKNMEATPGFEPGVKALQARALPLGHVALLTRKKGGARSRT